MFDVQLLLHYSLHFLVPGILAWSLFRPKWRVAWLVMVVTIIIDLDHLLAEPVFDPNRCSIGFHPLHSEYAICLYLLLLLIPNFYTRVIAVGLLLHIIADFQDCLWILS